MKFLLFSTLFQRGREGQGITGSGWGEDRKKQGRVREQQGGTGGGAGSGQGRTGMGQGVDREKWKGQEKHGVNREGTSRGQVGDRQGMRKTGKGWRDGSRGGRGCRAS